MSKPTTAPTAATVREFYRTNEARFNRLPEAAQSTVREGARGRLHPKAIADYNRNRKPNRRYVLGVGKAQVAQRAADRAAVEKAGIPVGKRGPLPKAAAEVLSQSKG